MRNRVLCMLLLLSALATACVSGAGQSKPARPASVEVLFSPKGGCQDAIFRELGAGKTYVHLQAYSFTSAPIARALVEAHKRGGKVEVVIDKDRVTENYSEATYFANQGLPVLSDGKHAIAHNKVMVIDGQTVLTASFTFTKAAEESNAENLLVIRSAEIAEKYEKNYQEHLAHSVKRERGQ